MRIPMRKTAFAAQGPRVKPEDCARYARLLHPSFADLVVLAGSLYPIPSRTRPLNSPAPMVLSLKAWKSRSLPGLPRTESSSRSEITKPLRHPRGGFLFVRGRNVSALCGRAVAHGRHAHTAATQSISTSNGPCQPATKTKLRAGGADEK